MDYEKKYKDALERARNLYNSEETGAEVMIACENVFPELIIEYGDERIRKAILSCLKYLETECGWDDVGDCDILDAYAWLEKQVPIDEEKVLIGARKDVALSIMNFLDRNTLSMCLSNMECEDIENAVVDSNWSKVYNYMKKKLEKQGGQKPLIEMKSPEESLGISTKEYNEVVTECLYSESKSDNNAEPKFKFDDFKAKDWYVSKVDGKIHNIYYSVDKVEPKFKVGDWVVGKNGNISKIMHVDNDFNHITYACCSIEESSRDWASYSENDIRLWDISDAKDGDVLVCPKYAGDIIPNIFIFKDIKIKDNDVFCYCSFLDTFRIEGYVANADPINTDFYPATKEQRDLLFLKMKEAGYEWDDENKKLNKIK